MDVRNLRQVLAIHRHGSFAKAAEALGLSQPSLSKSIARLEDELKVRVFVRTAHGSELTPIGELIVSRAERVMAETQNLIRDAELAAGGEAGQVRLGVGTLLENAFLPRLLVHVAEQHPRLRLTIEAGDADHLLPHLEARELDMVLCAFGPSLEQSDLVYARFLDAEVVVVAAPSHPLVAERAIPLERLMQTRCAGAATADFRNASLFGAEDDDNNVSAFMANDYEALMPLALAGMAVLVAPSFVVAEALAAGRLVRLDLERQFSVEFVTVTTRAASVSPILTRIARYARELAQEVQAEWRAEATPRPGALAH
jgi:DNA-binding transcriptional LysR family regulator